MNEEYDAMLNILVIGDKSAGKTCLLVRFAECAFSENTPMTLGMDYVDTMGQEQFHSITPFCYRGAHGIILAYDVTEQNTFNNLRYWLEHVNIYARDDVCKLLVGCKTDLTASRVVEYNTAQAFADQQGLQHIETSARNGTNVEEVFRVIAADIMQRSPPSTTETGSGNDVVRLHRGPPANNQRGFNRCCSSLKYFFKRRA